MRAVIQRVSQANVSVNDETVGEIAIGFVVLLGVEKGDTQEDVQYIAEKTAHLRVFEDDGQKMNQSLGEVGGEILLVSQFTLYGDARKGRRPSFSNAAPPQKAIPLYESLIHTWADMGLKVATGQFQTVMKVSLVNDGPVTILLDSKKLF